MVDAFVSFAVQQLGDFLIQEVALRSSLREDVHWLRNELLFMQSFSSVEGECDDHGFSSRLKACACICRKETNFYKRSKEIQSLKQRIMDISRKRETYGIRDIDNAGEGQSNRSNNRSDMVRTLRRTTSYVDEDQIFVGFQDVVERLLAELLKAEPRRSIISIYGMGGLGKTTLARILYNSPSLITSFHARAWICVSQEYNTLDLLRDLLKERKYLVVVDDVWQREAWESLKRAFPDNKNGSRVIITTRKEDVAERADDKGLVHRLRFLRQEESWDLFCRKLVDVRAMVPAMESLARDMVDKCGGLPLAIVVLSGLLSHKRGLEDWQKVKAHLWRHMKDDSIEISYILSLSYNDLSTVLKQCFLYFGIFPEDRLICANNIMWFWMAEGFIPRGEERMEDVAEGFLNELIRRSLIQVGGIFWEKVIKCRIHDLLRDLAVHKALELNFFHIYDPRKHSISSLCLRHAIHGQAERYLTLDPSNLKLRSITFFDQENHKLEFRIMFRNTFQHLYVLYLENRSVSDELPDAIGSLFHLKFLRLTDISTLPSSIGKLKNLQTLHVFDVYNTSFLRLPPETSKLKNLRHLVAPYSEPLQLISKLTSLQVLKHISCDQWKYVDPVDLVNVQELSMQNVKKSYSLNNISSLKNLSILILCCEFDESFPALEYLGSCQKLHKLWLEGRIEKLPLSDHFPSSITMMVLWNSKLMENPVPILGMLPNLRNLDLVRAYEGKKFTCNDNSFCQLEFLRLANLQNLEIWHSATSALPSIKGFGVQDCPKLKKIPELMKDVAILELLKATHLEAGAYQELTRNG